MTITTDTILQISAVITALGVIFGLIFAIYRWYLKQIQQGKEIERLQKENCLICFGLSACLDALVQLGANHETAAAKDKLDNFLNQSAHSQE